MVIVKKPVAPETFGRDCHRFIAEDRRPAVGYRPITITLRTRSSFSASYTLRELLRYIRVDRLVRAGGTHQVSSMPTTTQQRDEFDLEERVRRQKELVARLVSEGKQANDANKLLYELSSTLCGIRERRAGVSGVPEN